MRCGRGPLLVVAGILALAAQGFAQAQYDPSDPLYAYLDSWQGRGIIGSLPSIRPYPAEMLRSLLGTVISSGTAEDAAIAQGYRDRLTSSIDIRAMHASALRDVTYAGSAGLGSQAFLTIFPWASWSGRAAFSLITPNQGSVSAVSERNPVDFSEDGGSFNISLGGATIKYAENVNTAFSMADGHFSFQAGITRASFGPFFANGVVIGPQAPVSGNFVVSAELGAISIYQALFALADRIGGVLQSNKFLVLHGVDFTALPGLDLGFFESNLWSGRFEPLYLIPLGELFYLQSLAGYGDNSFIGFKADWRAAPGVQVMGLWYVDDGLQWAGQAGVRWTPAHGALRVLSADYTFVLPYTYTHYSPAVRQDAYTNWGVNEGPGLEPNSGRIEINAFMDPLPSLKLQGVGRFIRHGNASEGVLPGDGSINDPGHYAGRFNYLVNPWDVRNLADLRFLTQRVIDTTIQVGLGAIFTTTGPLGSLDFSARFLTEYRFNENLVPDSNHWHNYFSIGLSYAP